MADSVELDFGLRLVKSGVVLVPCTHVCQSVYIFLFI